MRGKLGHPSVKTAFLVKFQPIAQILRMDAVRREPASAELNFEKKIIEDPMRLFHIFCAPLIAAVSMTASLQAFAETAGAGSCDPENNPGSNA